MTDAAKAFWNDRAKLGETAGTQDLILKELEMRAILAEVNGLRPYRVLEVGCGLGHLARLIVRECPCVGHYVAVDNAKEMIDGAKAEPESEGVVFKHCELDNLPRGPFDCVITERMLINLQGEAEQRRALSAFASRLRPRGHYLMCEHSADGLRAINEQRSRLGLDEMSQPWHNRYIEDGDLWKIQPRSLKLVGCSRFTADYYFLSRVINAALAKRAGRAPSYSAPINKLALALQGCVSPALAQGRLWVWEKR